MAFNMLYIYKNERFPIFMMVSRMCPVKQYEPVAMEMEKLYGAKLDHKEPITLKAV